MDGMRRLHAIARHIHGHTEDPLWVDLMDAGQDSVLKPRYGCRCSSDKWRYICNCYPCLRWAGREEDFDWTPAVISAQPEAIPPQWKHKSQSLKVVACAKDLPRPSPKSQDELVTVDAGGIPRMRRPEDKAPYGPVAISGLPRFGGIATFARLPQLQELRKLQGASKALLRIRPVGETTAAARLCTPTKKRYKSNGDKGVEDCKEEDKIIPFEVIDEELSLKVSSEDGNLQVEVHGMQTTLALWTLPDVWYRHTFEFSESRDDGNEISHRLELDLLLEKYFEKFDIALVGVPFDSGCSYRPGARFGPEAIRSNSRLTRPYLIAQQQRPLQDRQVVDTGDLFATPFNIDQAIQQIYNGCKQRLELSQRLVVFGGDHTLSYPSIKAVAEKFGPVVLVHFDSHLDTFPPLWGQALSCHRFCSKIWENSVNIWSSLSSMFLKRTKR